jgi:hypothetical protein
MTKPVTRRSTKRWSRRKGVEFEREVLRRLAAVFGRAFVRRGVKSAAGHSPADIVAPRLWIECKSHRRANPRAALRQAEGGARAEGRWPVAVSKDNRQRTAGDHELRRLRRAAARLARAANATAVAAPRAARSEGCARGSRVHREAPDALPATEDRPLMTMNKNNIATGRSSGE